MWRPSLKITVSVYCMNAMPHGYVGNLQSFNLTDLDGRFPSLLTTNFLPQEV